jgi:catechol 2,3-dioxygenase-like lactoylglutathione lyase family enzyme
MLELIEYTKQRDTEDHGLPTSRVGVAHLALLVDDIHERYARMRAEGVRFRNPPVEITEGANAGGWACYLCDPDGITLELLQYAPERAGRLGIGS